MKNKRPIRYALLILIIIIIGFTSNYLVINTDISNFSIFSLIKFIYIFWSSNSISHYNLHFWIIYVQ